MTLFSLFTSDRMRTRKQTNTAKNKSSNVTNAAVKAFSTRNANQLNMQLNSARERFLSTPDVLLRLPDDSLLPTRAGVWISASKSFNAIFRSMPLDLNDIASMHDTENVPCLWQWTVFDVMHVLKHTEYVFFKCFVRRTAMEKLFHIIAHFRIDERCGRYAHEIIACAFFFAIDRVFLSLLFAHLTRLEPEVLPTCLQKLLAAAPADKKHLVLSRFIELISEPHEMFV